MAEPNEVVDMNALTAAEAQLILNVFDTINIKATDPNATQVCALIATSTPKLQRIVRVSQPLASAAKPSPKKEDDDEPANPVFDETYTPDETAVKAEESEAQAASA